MSENRDQGGRPGAQDPVDAPDNGSARARPTRKVAKDSNRGSRPGERRGGRRKGTPNKITADARKAFQMVYEGRLQDLDRWIRETGDGFPAVHFLSDGTECTYLERNPGKAAELLLRMAEHFVPKLGRLEHEVSGPGGGALEILIRDLAQPRNQEPEQE